MTSSAPARTDHLRTFAVSACVRVLGLPLSGASVLLTARMINQEYGVGSFAVYTLVAALPFLLPIADLGVGAAVTNAAARISSRPAEFVATLVAARRVLRTFSAVIAVLSVAVGVAGLWPVLLSLPDGHRDVGVTGALLVFAAGIPAASAARVLIGLGRNATVVAVQAGAPLLSLAGVALLAAGDWPFDAVLPMSMVGVTVGNWVLRGLAVRELGDLGQPVRGGTTTSSVSTRRLVASAGPMLVISLALVVTFQSHRLVLSWVSGVHQLAVYSAAAMLFAPALSVVQTAGNAFWPAFASVRGTGVEHSRRLFVRALGASATAGVLGGVLLVAVGPAVSGWATAGTIHIPTSVFAVFAVLLLGQSLHLPSGMYLTDDAGLQLQAVTTAVMAAGSVVGAVLLSGHLGATGPVLATVLSLTLFHLVPCAARTAYCLRGSA